MPVLAKLQLPISCIANTIIIVLGNSIWVQLLTLEMQNSVQFACNKVYSKVTEMRMKNDSNYNNNNYYYYKHERVLRKFKTVMWTPEEFKGLQNFWEISSQLLMFDICLSVFYLWCANFVEGNKCKCLHKAAERNVMIIHNTKHNCQNKLGNEGSQTEDNWPSRTFNQVHHVEIHWKVMFHILSRDMI